MVPSVKCSWRDANIEKKKKQKGMLMTGGKRNGSMIWSQILQENLKALFGSCHILITP